MQSKELYYLTENDTCIAEKFLTVDDHNVFCWKVAHPVQQVYIVHAFKDHAFRWKKPAPYVLPVLLHIRRANVGYLVLVNFSSSSTIELIDVSS